MSDRINSVLVTFENDIRDEDADGVIDAIRHIRGVIDVASNVSDYQLHVAEQRACQELLSKLWEVLRP